MFGTGDLVIFHKDVRHTGLQKFQDLARHAPFRARGRVAFRSLPFENTSRARLAFSLNLGA